MPHAKSRIFTSSIGLSTRLNVSLTISFAISGLVYTAPNSTSRSLDFKRLNDLCILKVNFEFKKDMWSCSHASMILSMSISGISRHFDDDVLKHIVIADEQALGYLLITNV